MTDWQVITGDCLEVMPTLEANSVDTILTDPPYGLSFMGKDWDHGVPGVHFWIEAMRVAKPGALLLAFGGTRTFHRLAVAIEDAGWEIRDTIMWIYGSGFPKSHQFHKSMNGNGAEWHGYGTALKPAFEPIIVAMKPLDGTFAQNAQRWGVAGMWIDGGRVGTADGHGGGRKGSSGFVNGYNMDGFVASPSGRWPANVIHDGSDEVLAGFPESKSAGKHNGEIVNSPARSWKNSSTAGIAHIDYTDTGSAARFFYCAKASRSERNAGLEGLPPVDRALSSFHSTRKQCSICGCTSTGGDHTGNAPGQMTCGHPMSAIIHVEYDRTSYHEKAHYNHHPTVKPLALMRYLARLTKTPTGGVILDPFAGSGSTGCAAIMERRSFIGIEISEEYADIARARIAKAAEQARQLELL